ncbi:DUF4209 domain-containing protein [Chitinophaga sp. RCC_12]|uniref:DUF4209 domain-containing protein n=1 Tax=Chitinophaga sp. RCC_12 TaxID=3239226 RepID=UPI00352375AF
MTEAKNDGMNYKILDSILKDPAFIAETGENDSLYLRTILTSNQGWNLRNAVCHGMTNDNTFTSVQADRIFLVILYLAAYTLEFE